MVELDDRNRSSDDVQVAQLWRDFFICKSDELRENLFDVYHEFAKRLGLGLYKKYSGFGICVDDVVQNAYLGLYVAIDRYKLYQGARFETFAGYRIKGEILNGFKSYSENLSLYHYKRKLERERIDVIIKSAGNRKDLDSLFSLALNIVASSIIEFVDYDASYTEDSQIEEKPHTISARNIMRIVDKLPESNRRVITMHYFYDYTFSEIADITQYSKSAVYKQFCTSLELIRNQLSDFDRELITI